LLEHPAVVVAVHAVAAAHNAQEILLSLSDGIWRKPVGVAFAVCRRDSCMQDASAHCYRVLVYVSQMCLCKDM
jgi:predicted transcriptional regulator